MDILIAAKRFVNYKAISVFESIIHLPSGAKEQPLYLKHFVCSFTNISEDNCFFYLKPQKRTSIINKPNSAWGGW